MTEKADKERGGWVAEENLRKAKNDLFNAEQEIDALKVEENKQQETLAQNNAEIER